MKAFDEVWADIKKVLNDKEEIRTLCMEVKNYVVKVAEDHIDIRSSRSRKQITRRIGKTDFNYVWDVLIRVGSCTLGNLQRIIGRRSITCAIMALLGYVEGTCEQGRAALKLKT